MAATEKLIQTVHAYAVLYNASLHDYRSAERRVKAWREVAASVGLSVVECKRRWKTVRDRYIRERRLCELKKEDGGRRLHYWPHRESLSFLDAHIRKRRRLSEAEAPDDSPEDSLDESGGGDSKPSLERAKEFVLSVPQSKPQLKPLSQLPLSIVAQLAPVKPLQPVSQLAVVSRLPPGLKVSQASASTPQPLPLISDSSSKLTHSQKETEKAQLDEDELFLLSYVPALKRLTPQKRAAVKMQIQQIMFDAEFKDQ